MFGHFTTLYMKGLMFFHQFREETDFGILTLWCVQKHKVSQKTELQATTEFNKDHDIKIGDCAYPLYQIFSIYIKLFNHFIGSAKYAQVL